MAPGSGSGSGSGIRISCGDLDPESGCQLKCGSMRIRIRNTGLDSDGKNQKESTRNIMASYSIAGYALNRNLFPNHTLS